MRLLTIAKMHYLKASFLHHFFKMILLDIFARALDVFACTYVLNSQLSWHGKLGAGLGILVAYLVLAYGLQLMKPWARKRLTLPQDPTPEPGPDLLVGY
jgi:hypothetical protein